MTKLNKSLEFLFVSKVRIKALKYFLLNPAMSLHLRGVVRELKEEINAVRRETMRLEEIGIIQSENKGNRKYFKLNLEHPFTDELLAIFHKTYGLGAEIVANSKKLGVIDWAILTPAFTRGVYYGDQVIDLAIIGSVDMNLLSSIISKYEGATGQEIHYTVLKPSEFQLRKRRKDDFIMNLMLQDTVMLIGKHEELLRV